MKPGGIVALTAAALAAGTAWHYATRPPGDWWTDTVADRYAECMPQCADQPFVVKSTGQRPIIQIHHDELNDMSAVFGGYGPAMTACYELRHNNKRLGGAWRVDCPQNGTTP